MACEALTVSTPFLLSIHVSFITIHQSTGCEIDFSGFLVNESGVLCMVLFISNPMMWHNL